MKFQTIALLTILVSTSTFSFAKDTLPTIGKWEHTTYSAGHDVVQSTESAKVTPKPNHKMTLEHADYIQYTVKYVEQPKPNVPLVVISAGFYEDSLLGKDKFFDVVEASDGYVEVDKPKSVVLQVNDQKVAFKRTYLSPHQYVMHPETLPGLTYVLGQLIEGNDLVIKGNSYGDYRIEADGFKEKFQIDESSEVL